MIELCKNSEYINFIGFHSHIGSQIFDLEAFNQAIKKMLTICKDFEYPLVLNLGGGFGVHYTDLDKPVPYDEVAKFLINSVETELKNNNLKIYLGYDSNAFSGDTLILSSTDLYSYSKMRRGRNNKNLILKWIHKVDDNTYKRLSEEDADVTLYWVR